jgi:hypothetical protein
MTRRLPSPGANFTKAFTSGVSFHPVNGSTVLVDDYAGTPFD